MSDLLLWVQIVIKTTNIHAVFCILFCNYCIFTVVCILFVIKLRLYGWKKNYTIYTIIFSLFNQQYYSMWLPVEAVVFTQTPSLINGSIRVDPLGLVLPFSLDNNLRSVTRDRGTTEKHSCSSVDLENFLDSVDIPIFYAFRALADLSTQPSSPYSDFLTETILSYKSIEFLCFIRTSKTCNDTESNLISLELQAMFTKEISYLQFVSLQDRYFAIAMFFYICT